MTVNKQVAIPGFGYRNLFFFFYCEINMDQDPGRVFYAKSIKPGERDPPSLDLIHTLIVERLSNLDDKEIKNMADIIIELIRELRELKSKE